MGKHVAATLYGVGFRLDEDPLLFYLEAGGYRGVGGAGHSGK